MPHLEDQVINSYLKEICKDAGIDKQENSNRDNPHTRKGAWASLRRFRYDRLVSIGSRIRMRVV